MNRIVGASLSQFHGDENNYELLIAFGDGREIGHIVTKQVAQELAKELTEQSGLDITEGMWRPIEEADKSIVHQQHFPLVGMTIRNSERYWVRDADGRVYEASWSENSGRDYWWDWEGESPVDPVEYMPHPLSTPHTPTGE